MKFILFLTIALLTGAAFSQTNDSVRQAISIGGLESAALEFDPEGATRESEEPAHNGNDTSGSLWWEWTAPDDGLLTLTSDKDGTVALYEGLFFHNFTQISPNNEEFPVASGVRYKIACAGTNSFQTNLSFTRPNSPANDHFSNAQILEGYDVDTTFDLSGSTLEENEPNFVRSVWFKWIAPEAGELTINGTLENDDSSFLVKFGTFNGGSVGELRELGKTDARENSYPIIHALDPGQTVMIQVTGKNFDRLNTEGSLSLDFEPTFANDSHLAPIDLGVAPSLDFIADNTGATRNPLDWDGINRDHSGSVWYQWTATGDGFLYVLPDSHSSQFDPVVSLHSGDGDLDDQPLATSSGSSRSPVSAGETYLLSYSTNENHLDGLSDVSLRFENVHEEYQHTHALPLPSESSVQMTGSFRHSLLDESISYEELREQEWHSLPSSSLWYSWTAPSSGSFIINRTQGYSTMAVWQNDEVNGPILLTGDQSGTLSFTAVGGQSYLISALTTSSPGYLLSSFFRWEMKPLETPSNDLFEDRQDMGMTSEWSVETHNHLATDEPNEPSHTDNPPQKTLWFSWAAPTSGHLLLDLPSSRSSYALAVYTGNELTNLTPTANGIYRVMFSAQEGQVYQIAVDSDGYLPGDFTLTLQPAIRPDNDDFASRTKSTGRRPVLTGNLRYATAEPDEQFADSHTSASVWFEWTASSSTTLHYSRYVTQIYESPVPNPTLADLTLPTPTGYNDRISVRSGRTYYLQVFRRDSSAGSSFQIDTSGIEASYSNRGPTIRNQDFVDRTILPSRTHLRAGTDGRTADRQPIGTSSIPNSFAAWWSWTAPESGVCRLDRGADYRSGICVFTGEELDSLIEVHCVTTQLTYFAVKAGVTYHIVPYRTIRGISNRSSAPWLGFDLKLINSPPENDAFENALKLRFPVDFKSEQHNFEATSQAGETSPGGIASARTVWTSYTPKWSSDVIFDTTDTSCHIAVYSGNALDNLVELASGSGPLQVSLEAGINYSISVDSPEPLAFTLTGEMIYPALTNNDYAEAIAWNESSHATFGNGDNQDMEEGEPLPLGADISHHSSWWKWTAPHTGATTFQLTGSSLIFTIYKGDSLESLEPLVTTNSTYYPMRFYAIAGETYSLQLVNQSSGSSGNLSLTLTQDLGAPVNDLFANATPLSGKSLSFQVDPSGSSFEANEPFSATRSIWYAWLVPENGSYQVSANRGSTKIFRGDDLSTLTAISAKTIQATAGETLRIALTSSAPSALEFSITQLQPLLNDDFANRTDLGSLEEISFSYFQANSTLEMDEPTYSGSRQPEGTLWWSWTAPRDGMVSFSSHLDVFVGSTLPGIFPVNIDEAASRFIAASGTTYHFVSKNNTSSSDDTSNFHLTMQRISNDDFDDRLVIPVQLPFSWEGALPNATFEPRERVEKSGSAWWEWTAPKDGRIGLRTETNDLWVYRNGSSIGELYRLSAFSTNQQEVLEGETYFFQLLGKGLESSSFLLDWIESANEEISRAQIIERIGEPIQIPAQVREHLSHWYRWTAHASGTLTIENNGGLQFSATLSSGNYPQKLQSIDDQFGSNQSFEVRAGENYWIALREGSGKPFEWTPRFGPLGDAFDTAPSLPSTLSVAWTGDTTGAGWEEKEPVFASVPSTRTVWRKWIAPRTGTYYFTVDYHQAAICQGEEIGGLAVLAEGKSGTFKAIQGETYHLVVNSREYGDAFTFAIDPLVETYENWRTLYLQDYELSDSKPNSDPDRDGRSNLIEMALGSDPKHQDGAIDLWIEESDGAILLNVSRPSGIEGIKYSFDMTSDLESWQSTQDLEHEFWTNDQGDGMEIFRVKLTGTVLRDQQKFFVRLSASLNPSNN
jgi:hypothetical protein